MPGRHEIQRGVGRFHVADVQDPGQAPARHEHVAGNQVGVAHHVAARAARQLPHDLPHAAQPGNVQQLAAALEAGLQKRVMGSQVAAPSTPAERPAPRVDRADAADELGQVMCERGGLSGVVVVGRYPGQPGLHRPGKRVARAGFAERHGFGRGEPRAPRQLTGGRRLGLQHRPHPACVTALQREPGGEPLADAEDGVDRARRIHRLDGQAPPLGKLLVHQLANRLRRDGQLAVVHVHVAG
jgi:hypothetical protein